MTDDSLLLQLSNLKLESMENKLRDEKRYMTNENCKLKALINDNGKENIEFQYKGITRRNLVSREFHCMNPDFSHNIFGMTKTFAQLLVLIEIMFPGVTVDTTISGDYGERISVFEMILIWLLLVHGGFSRFTIKTIYNVDYSVICKIIRSIAPHMGQLGKDLSDLDVTKEFFDVSRPVECHEYFLKTGYKADLVEDGKARDVAADRKNNLLKRSYWTNFTVITPGYGKCV